MATKLDKESWSIVPCVAVDTVPSKLATTVPVVSISAVLPGSVVVRPKYHLGVDIPVLAS